MNKKVSAVGEQLVGIFAFSLIAGVIPGLAGALGEFLIIGSDQYFDLSWSVRVPILIFMGLCLHWFFVIRKKV